MVAVCFTAFWASFVVFDIYSFFVYFLLDVALLCCSNHNTERKGQGNMHFIFNFNLYSNDPKLAIDTHCCRRHHVSSVVLLQGNLDKFSEGPRGWQNVFAVMRFHYNKVLSIYCTITRGKNVLSYIE